MADSKEKSMIYGRDLVPADQIEGHIEKIRNQAALNDAKLEAKRGSIPAPRARATLSNLIILNLSGGAKAERQINSLIDKVCIAYPSRYFIVDASVEGQAELKTAVSSRCFLADNGTHVCSEEIYISASEKSVKSVPNLLLSLFASDVDVIMAVFNDGRQITKIEKELFKNLFATADRVIFDSSYITDGQDDYLEILDPTKGKLCDLNWRRLRKWRMLIAEGFSVDKLTNAAKAINKVTISTKFIQGKIPFTAKIFASWLLSSLELNPHLNTEEIDVNKKTYICKNEGHKVLLTFHGQSNQISADLGFSKIEINFSDTLYHGHVIISVDDRANIVEIATKVVDKINESEQSASRTVPYLRQDTAELLIPYLTARKDDLEFQNSYRLAKII